MSNLIKLTRKDIEQRYNKKPILIEYDNESKWYIVKNEYSRMPLHMLTSEESELYDQNKNNIDGIKLSGTGEEYSYAMWIYFEKEDGWKAYGYE